MLKKMRFEQLKANYKVVRSILLFLLSGILLFFYPLKLVLSAWLPKYAESLLYMALLFPMCLFESKTTLLINTYMKAMREEKVLCLVNILTVAVSGIAAVVTVFWMENLVAAIVSIPYLLALRGILLEVFLGKRLGVSLLKEAFVEVALATCFMIFSWNIDSWLTMLAYFAIYASYVVYIRKDLCIAFQKFSRA